MMQLISLCFVCCFLMFKGDNAFEKSIPSDIGSLTHLTELLLGKKIHAIIMMMIDNSISRKEKASSAFVN